MTEHAKETMMLWDAFQPMMQISATDNQEKMMLKISDEHELSELCSICEEGFIGPDGCSNGCND